MRGSSVHCRHLLRSETIARLRTPFKDTVPCPDCPSTRPDAEDGHGAAVGDGACGPRIKVVMLR